MAGQFGIAVKISACKNIKMMRRKLMSAKLEPLAAKKLLHNMETTYTKLALYEENTPVTSH